MKRQLCLNAIVRNESARVLRMLNSVRDHITTFAILDTGSTDDTVAVIERWGLENEIKGVVGRGAFVDFSQARNQALDLARSWWRLPDTPKFTYLLLVDADMELVVTDPNVFANLQAPAYELKQIAGSMSYNNVRIVHAKPTFKYVGVTHEYLDCGGSLYLDGAHFLDHADGSNRTEKYPRDIRLLEGDLARDPENPRTWFYLANTHRDAGNHAAALAAYRRRLALGGWDEEVWNTQVNIANCLAKQGLEDAYIKEALAAFQMRPRRAEPLYALARHFRTKGDNALAMLFAEAGLLINKPDDRLFIEDWVYDWGFLEEISIAGYYDEKTRDLARAANETLMISKSVPEHTRWQARNNNAFYLKPLSSLCPSYTPRRVAFDPPEGFVAMNPSVTTTPSGDLEFLIRTVNYKIDEHGRYMIAVLAQDNKSLAPIHKECSEAPIVTRNYLAHIRDEHPTEVWWSRPEAAFPLVIGLEDMRIFYRDGTRHFIANIREQSEIGQCVQHTGVLDDNGAVVSWKRISNGVDIEKNWMPWHDGRYIYRLDKLIDENGNIEKVERSVAVDNISGSSQWVDFDGGFLSVVHESLTHPGTGKRVYQHRFAWLSPDFRELKLSGPFVFQDVQIEFAAGLARQGSVLTISYGVRDAEAWTCTVSVEDVQCALAS